MTFLIETDLQFNDAVPRNSVTLQDKFSLYSYAHLDCLRNYYTNYSDQTNK